MSTNNDEFEVQKALGTLKQYFVDVMFEYDDGKTIGHQMYAWACNHDDACTRVVNELMRTISRPSHIVHKDASAMLLGEELPINNEDGTPYEIEGDVELID